MSLTILGCCIVFSHTLASLLVTSNELFAREEISEI